MNNEIIQKLFQVKSSTIDDMKDLLHQIKFYKDEKLSQRVKELEDELKEIQKAKKYWLVWEEKQEIFDKETIWKLPVLEEIKEKNIYQDISQNNILIEWDNYHTLSVLNYTHAWKIDVIYIDPPYNTWNKSWKYNNNYVDKDDTFRHSKWLSFMNKRLKLAKHLLKPEWYLIFAIDHNEVHTSWLLLQEIFPEKEVTCITVIHNPSWIQWKNFSHNNEYIFFVYPQSTNKVINFEERNDENADIRWFMNSAKWNTSNYLRITWPNSFYPILIKENEIIWFWEVPDENFHPDSSNIYKENWIIEIYPIDSNWEERKWTLARNSVEEFKDELSIKYSTKKKLYEVIRTKKNINYKTVWIDNKFNAKKYWTELLKEILNIDFPFPKSLHLVKECIKAVNHNKNSTILDFFAWSWTTWHAVLELNKEDNWNRKFILATNNENNICEEVTYERIKRVMTWYTNQKWEQVQWLWWNLTYLRNVFIDKSNVNDDLRTRMVSRCSELLCLKENIWQLVEIQINEHIKIFQRHDKYLAILYDMFYFEEFKEVLKNLEKPISIYAFSHYKLTKSDFEEIKNIEIEQIPDPILEVYESIFWL